MKDRESQAPDEATAVSMKKAMYRHLIIGEIPPANLLQNLFRIAQISDKRHTCVLTSAVDRATKSIQQSILVS